MLNSFTNAVGVSVVFSRFYVHEMASANSLTRFINDEMTLLILVTSHGSGSSPSSSDMTSNPRKPFHIVSLPYLTKLAHGSAPFLATFLLIHLAAPAVANLGGSSLSSQTMVRRA